MLHSQGYRYEDVPLPSVAFFPLLPLLMRLLGGLTGDVVTTGILISNASLLAAMMLLYRLADEEFGPAAADRSVWYTPQFRPADEPAALHVGPLPRVHPVGPLGSPSVG